MHDTTEPAITCATGLSRILGWLAVSLLWMQQPVAEDSPTPQPPDAAFSPATMDLCAATEDGYLSGDLFGALSKHIEWRGADMDCGGMLRPDKNGIRLVFAAPRQGERLLIVLGINGDLSELVSGEHTTNITIVDEARNRFFSTGQQERCWSTIESIQPVANRTDRILQVTGEVYCAGSLPSLSDNNSIALRDVHYSGRLLLDEPDQR